MRSFFLNPSNLQADGVLADRYIYFNDDFFVLQPTQPSTFFTADGGIKVYHELTNAALAEGTTEWASWSRHTVETLTSRFKLPDQWIVQNPAHAPLVTYKKAMQGMHHHFGAQLRETASHTFRHDRDFAVYIAHAYYAHMSSCCSPVTWSKDETFSYIGKYYLSLLSKVRLTFVIGWTDNSTWNSFQFEMLNLIQPTFFNVNDEMTALGSRTGSRQLKFQLNRLFPIPSAFELTSG